MRRDHELVFRWTCALGPLACACLALFLVGCRPERHDPPLFLCALPANAASAHAARIDGTAYYVAPTGSMEPLLTGGDYVVVDGRIPLTRDLLGHVITYHAAWQPDGLLRVTHRMTDWDQYGGICEGDANRHSESRWRVTAANYIGAVVAIYRLKSDERNK